MFLNNFLKKYLPTKINYKYLSSKSIPRWVLFYSDFCRASDNTINTMTSSLSLCGWSDRNFENSRESHDKMNGFGIRNIVKEESGVFVFSFESL